VFVLYHFYDKSEVVVLRVNHTFAAVIVKSVCLVNVKLHFVWCNFFIYWDSDVIKVRVGQQLLCRPPEIRVELEHVLQHGFQLLAHTHLVEELVRSFTAIVLVLNVVQRVLGVDETEVLLVQFSNFIHDYYHLVFRHIVFLRQVWRKRETKPSFKKHALVSFLFYNLGKFVDAAAQAPYVGGLVILVFKDADFRASVPPGTNMRRHCSFPLYALHF
jgi:hypothetical protein